MKCDRCWSEESVRPYASPDPQPGALDDREVLLCSACRAAAPADGVLFARLFLRFASRKELLRHYGTSRAREAARRWCDEEGVDPHEMAKALDRGGEGLDLLRPSDFARPGRGGPPYGYRVHQGRWAQDPTEGATVRGIFRRYADGESLEGIVEALRRAEVPTRRGGRWHRSTVRYILRNPVYAGFRRRRGRLWKEHHPPLVEDEIFADVQRRLEERSRRPDQKAPQTPVQA